MATLSRVRVELTGGAITGPGVATFYTDTDAGALQAALKTFWNAVRSAMPNNLSILIPAAGEQLDAEDGSVIGSWAAGPPQNYSGSGGTVYAQGVGARIRWETAGHTGRRRVRGSTYIVPLVGSMYSANGTIDDGIITTFQNAGNALLATMDGTMIVWHRPTTTTSNDGVAHPITSCVAVDKTSWLKTRRT